MNTNITFFAQLTADAAGQVGHRLSLRNITRAYDGTGTYTDSGALASVFDMYKPTNIVISGVPTFATTIFSAGSLMVVKDEDDNDLTQGITTYADTINYHHKYQVNPRETWDCPFEIDKLNSGSIPGQLTTTPATIVDGFLDFNAPPYDGVVYIVGGGFPANQVIADMVITMTIICRGRR